MSINELVRTEGRIVERLSSAIPTKASPLKVVSVFVGDAGD
jgi:hypothetical protein